MGKFQVERDILIYAFRYALGRMTFAPITVVENIKNNIDKFKDHDLERFIKEIDEQGNYGMDCDKATWLGFKSYLEQEIETRNQK